MRWDAREVHSDLSIERLSHAGYRKLYMDQRKFEYIKRNLAIGVIDEMMKV